MSGGDENNERNIGPGSLAHLLLAVVTAAAVMTGLLLYVPVLRGPTADLRWLLAKLHLGAALIVPFLLAANFPFFLSKRTLIKIGGYEWSAVLLFTFIASQLASGLMLHFGASGVIDQSYDAILVHTVLGLFLLPLMGYHVFAVFRPKPQAAMLAVADRRAFLIKLAAALAAAAGWAGLEGLKDFIAKARNRENMTYFEDCNRLTPAPESAVPQPLATGGYKGDFRVYTVTAIPCATNANWSLSIGGLVERPQSLSWPEFAALRRKAQVSDFHCVEGWSVREVTYEGIPLANLLALAGLKPEARFVKFVSADGAYSDALSLQQALLDDVMLAVLIDGKPIPSDLGGPARLIVPQMFAYKSVKWVNAIEVLSSPHVGYWEQRGYQVDAWIRRPQGG